MIKLTSQIDNTHHSKTGGSSREHLLESSVKYWDKDATASYLLLYNGRSRTAESADLTHSGILPKPFDSSMFSYANAFAIRSSLEILASA
jgi:hypothetical protein